MAWTKMKIAIAAGVGLLIAAGVTTVTVKKVQHHRQQVMWDSITRVMNETFRGGRNPSANRDWNALPQTIAFRATGFKNGYGDESFIRGGKNDRMVGIRMPVEALLVHTFDIGRMRIVNREALPAGRYDFFVSMPNRHIAMEDEIKKQLGLSVHKEIINTNVFLMTITRSNPTWLTPISDGVLKDRPRRQTGHVRFDTMEAIRHFAELNLKIPVIDASGISETNKYNIDFIWNQDKRLNDTETLKQSLFDQLGLQLTPTNEDLEMLVWKK